MWRMERTADFLGISTLQVNVFQDRLERVQRYAEHPMPYIYKQVCMTHLTIPPKSAYFDESSNESSENISRL